MSEEFAEQIEQIVLNRVENDDLLLPPMPAVATKCMSILRDPDYSLAQLSPILEQDPMLVAQIIKGASSAAMGSKPQQMNISQAVSRLGAKNLKAFLVDASAKTVFASKDKRIREVTRDMWSHSVATGMLARDVAVIGGQADGESAYMSGVLHDIGKPVVAAMMLEAERTFSRRGRSEFISVDEFIFTINKVHRKVGVAIAKAWSLPEEIAVTIRDCSEYNAGNRSAVSNFVCFGNALAKQAGICLSTDDIEDAKALVMIGRSMLGVDEGMIDRLTAELKERVSSYYK